ALPAGVGGCADLRLEVAFRRLRRHVEALAGDVELPAVVDAAEAFFFIAAEEERRTPMGAGVLDESGGAGGRPKGDQVLADKPNGLLLHHRDKSGHRPGASRTFAC